MFRVLYNRYSRIIILLSFLFLIIVPLESHSATVEIMNTNDSCPSSLRHAIMDTNPAGGYPPLVIFSIGLSGLNKALQ